MESNHPKQQIANMRQSLFDEKHINQQFVQLEELEGGDRPNFAEFVIGRYFRNSAKLITKVEQELEKTPLDFGMLEKLLHEFQGSSVSVGANNVMTKVNQLRGYVNERTTESCKAAFQLIKGEQETLKNKLQIYFQMKRQVSPVEIAERPEYDDEDSDA